MDIQSFAKPVFACIAEWQTKMTVTDLDDMNHDTVCR